MRGCVYGDEEEGGKGLMVDRLMVDRLKVIGQKKIKIKGEDEKCTLK